MSMLLENKQLMMFRFFTFVEQIRNSSIIEE